MCYNYNMETNGEYSILGISYKTRNKIGTFIYRHIAIAPWFKLIIYAQRIGFLFPAKISNRIFFFIENNIRPAFDLYSIYAEYFIDTIFSLHKYYE